jgi:hypothetical protein
MIAWGGVNIAKPLFSFYEYNHRQHTGMYAPTQPIAPEDEEATYKAEIERSFTWEEISYLVSREGN